MASAPTVRAVGAIASGTTTISPGLPTGTAAGDLLLMFCECDGAESVTASGWTEVTSVAADNATASDTKLTVLSRISQDGADATTTNDPGDHIVGRIIGITAGTFALRDAANPADQTWLNGLQTSSETTEDTSASLSACTTDVGQCLIVAAIAHGNDPAANGTANYSGFTDASLTSITERIDNTRTSGAGGGLGVATGVLAAPGSSGTMTATLAVASCKAMAMFGIAPPVIKAGYGVAGLIGGGSYEVVGITYTKTGVGIMGAPSTLERTGVGVAGLVGSGASDYTSGSGTTYTKAGYATAGADGYGARAMEYAKSGYGIIGVPHVRERTGYGVVGFVGSGASDILGGTTYTKTGAGVAGLVGAGERAMEYTEAGAGIAGADGSGARAVIYAKSGYGSAGLVGSGAKAVTYSETGYGVAGLTASGESTTGTPGDFSTLYKGTWSNGLVIDTTRQIVRTPANRVFFFAHDDGDAQGAYGSTDRDLAGVTPMRAMRGDQVPIPTSFIEVDSGNHPTITDGDAYSAPQVVLDSDGVAHLVYTHWDLSSGDRRLLYAQFDTGSSTWTLIDEVVVSTGVNYINHWWMRAFWASAIALDSGGTVHVVYSDGNNVKHKTRTGVGSWSSATTITSGYTDPLHHMMIANGDELHVTWATNESGGTLTRIGYAHYTGSSWDIVETVAGTSDVWIVSDFDQSPAVGLNASGNAEVQYINGSHVMRLLERTGTATWAAPITQPTFDTHSSTGYWQGTDRYLFEGHDLPASGYLKPAYIKSVSGGAWSSAEITFATGDNQDADGSASVRYDPQYDPSPGYIDWLAWDEDDGDHASYQHRGKAYYICLQPSVLATGAGVAGLVGAGAKAVTYAETGTGIVGADGYGASEHVPAGGTTYEKSGYGVAGLDGAGDRAGEHDRTGAGVAGLDGYGVRAVEYAETGTGIVGATASGSKTVSGYTIYVKSGYGTVGADGSGAKAVEYDEAGTGVAGADGSGSRAVEYSETGTGVVGAVGGGSRAGFTFTKSGSASCGLVGGGARAKDIIRTGYATVGTAASGAREGVKARTGSGTVGALGAGARAVVYVESGYGAVGGVGAGDRVVTFTKSGYAIVGVAGFGTSAHFVFGTEGRPRGRVVLAPRATGPVLVRSARGSTVDRRAIGEVVRP